MTKTEKAWIFDEVIKGKQKVKKPTDSKLKIITRIGEKVVEKKKVIAKIEEEVKLAREQLRKIVEEELPDAMTSVNLKYFELIDGTEFSVKEEIFVSITEDKRAGALKWLETNGHGDLIKHDVKVSFGRGDHDHAENLKKILGKSFKSIPYDERMTVHSGTLKAFAKERYSLGETLPEEHFSVYEANIAKVKLGKEK